MSGTTTEATTREPATEETSQLIASDTGAVDEPCCLSTKIPTRAR